MEYPTHTVLAPGWVYFKPAIRPVPPGMRKPDPLPAVIAQQSRLASGLQGAMTPEPLKKIKEAINGAVEKYSQKPVSVLWRYSDAQILPARVEISEFSSDPRKYDPLRIMFKLAGYPEPGKTLAQSIAHAGHQTRNLLNRVAMRTTEYVRGVWPEFSPVEIVLSPNGNFIDISIKDQYSHFPIEQRSDGFKRFIAFLLQVSATAAADQSRDVLYLQDEPETGLHPAGVRHLRDELIKLGKQNCVVASTHSIFMVDKENVSRHLLVSKSSEVTTISVVGNSNIADEEVVYNALNFSNFDVIERNVVVFEGWKDKKLFDVFRDGLLRSGDPIEGLGGMGRYFSRGVKDIPRVATVLQGRDRRLLAVTDGDAVACEEQRRSHELIPWKRYDEFPELASVRTAEDFLSGSILASCFSKELEARGIATNLADEFDFEPGDVLNRVRDLLIGAGQEAQAAKEIVAAWKERLFSDLKYEDVRETYRNVLVGVCDAFRS